jgi:hypothetical protein
MAATEYTPKPQPTLEDVQALVTFVRDRARSVTRAAALGTDAYRTAQALCDIASMMSGAAEEQASRGKKLGLLHSYLAMAAQRWPDHPDFDPTWRDE